MINESKEWFKKVNFQKIKFNDFPIKQEKQYYFTEWPEGVHFTLMYKRNNYCYFLSPKGTMIKDNLLVLNDYKHILDKQTKIKEIIIPGTIAAWENGKILSIKQTLYILKHADTSIKYQRLLHHYAEDIYKYNNTIIDYPLAINYLTALFYNTKTKIRAINFYKGDLKVAWNHFGKKHKFGILARGKVNYKIQKG